MRMKKIRKKEMRKTGRMRKYKLIKEEGTTLKRLVALRSFGNVAKGDKGGLIEKGANLSHEGNCWVYGDALVSGDAWVSGRFDIIGKINYELPRAVLDTRKALKLKKFLKELSEDE